MHCLIVHCTLLLVCVFQTSIGQITQPDHSNHHVPETPTPGPPIFLANNQSIFNIQEGGTETIHCIARGNPLPGNISWRKDGNLSLAQLGIPKIQRTRDFDDTFLVIASITIPKPNSTHAGNYTCSASNSHGAIHRTISVNVINTSQGGNGAFIGGISFTIVVVTLLVVWIFFEFFHKPKNGLSKAEIKEFLLGNEELISNSQYAHENVAHMPYNKNYEIPTNKLYVSRGDILGSGAFGQVFKGRVNQNVVAVKTCKPGADKMYLKSLLMELKVMIYLGPHPNVIKLIGASTGKVASGIVYIIVECCELGNLEKYIREHEKKFLNLFDNNGKLFPMSQNDAEAPLNTYDLLNWSYQIANGMEFLGSKKVIHGDLACRNILLASRSTVKITDFGLARQLYDYANYVKRNMEPLPWRWMAYESLRELTFSTITDIWSFGVTIWEIFTLGEVPYPGLAWNNDFMTSLENNFRLAKPKHASFDLYGELLRCWELDGKKRPNFEYWKIYFHTKFERKDYDYTVLNDYKFGM